MTTRRARVVAVGHRNGKIDEILLAFDDGLRPERLTVTAFPMEKDFDDADFVNVEDGT